MRWPLRLACGIALGLGLALAWPLHVMTEGHIMTGPPIYSIREYGPYTGPLARIRASCLFSPCHVPKAMLQYTCRHPRFIPVYCHMCCALSARGRARDSPPTRRRRFLPCDPDPFLDYEINDTRAPHRRRNSQPLGDSVGEECFARLHCPCWALRMLHERALQLCH